MEHSLQIFFFFLNKISIFMSMVLHLWVLSFKATSGSNIFFSVYLSHNEILQNKNKG